MQLIRHTGIREEAARWYARLHAHDCSESDHAAFHCWLQYPRNFEAYAQIEAFASRVGAAASNSRLQALADEAFGAASHDIAKRSPRWHVPAALAASLAVASVTAIYMRGALDDPHRAVAYEAGAERTSVTLVDGTVVQLDVNTRIAVNIDDQRREVRLLEGRAMFDVVKDASRPFSVEADGSRTTALGTRFQVQESADQVLVTLEEGSVAVESAGEHEFYERLSPGEQLSISARNSLHEKRNVDLQAVTGWTRGRLVFRGTSLAQAADEMNRYSQMKVRIGDPSIAKLPVGGNFIIGDSEMIVDALVAALPIRAVRSGDQEIILFQRHDTDVPIESP
jgi:transmembrane sensor